MRAFKNFKEEVIDKLLGFFITQRETHFFENTRQIVLIAVAHKF